MAEDDGDKQEVKTEPTTIDKIRAHATLIAAIAALATAAGSWFKPQDTKVSKGIYDELVAQVKDVTKAVAQNHADNVALTKYVEGYMHWQEMNLHCPIGYLFDGSRCMLMVPVETSMISEPSATVRGSNPAPTWRPPRVTAAISSAPPPFVTPAASASAPFIMSVSSAAPNSSTLAQVTPPRPPPPSPPPQFRSPPSFTDVASK